jgi:phage terminase large subunit
MNYMQNEKPQKKLSELINPTPQQLVAFEALKWFKYILYGGAMGGGKSYWLRWAVVVLLISFTRRFGVRGVYAGIFCEDYRTLEDRQISKVKSEFPRWLGTLNKSNHEFTLSEEYGSHIIAFRNLDDPGKYDSAEFAIIAIDEMTKNPESIFGILRRRLRWPGIPAKELRFLGGTNPGGIGHNWVKKLFILREFDPNEQESEQFKYIPAKATDNPHLDPNYLLTLQSMGEKERKAYLEGDWDVFAGQFFSKEWGREWNICEPFPIPQHWPRFICLDYGYSAPSAVFWLAIDDYGRIYVYREVYGPGMTYRKLGRVISEMTPKDDPVDLIVADPAIFSKTGHQDDDSEPRSGADELAEGMNGRFVVIRGNNDRVNGWGIMRQYMEQKKYDEKISSRLIFFNTCKNAIRTIPALIHDEVRGEDVDSDGEDHAGDAIRYGIMHVDEEEKAKQPRKERSGRRTAEELFEDDMLQLRQKAEENDNPSWMNI